MTIPNNLTEELKDVIQDCNINFLIGSGLSRPYLPLLGNTEELLTKLSEKRDKEETEKDQEKLIRASIYMKFFDDIIYKNIDLLSEKEKCQQLKDTLSNYQTFIKIINTIILNRRSAILSKQVNIFTTNFDIFLDKSLEISNVEYNDGFSTRFNLIFNLSNFKKSIFKRSLHYDNIYELPVFNLIKLHGSLTWNKESGKEDIFFDKHLRLVRKIKQISIRNDLLIDVKQNDININNLIVKIKKIKNKKSDDTIEKFIKEYENLAIINPTKEKFKETILNRNYYELLRIYSTELEKENTVLFVMGFSFQDEHIREVTIRVANSNPTLKIYIFSYDEQSKNSIEEKIKNSHLNNENVKTISPKDLIDDEQENQDLKFNFDAINEKIFKPLLKATNE